MDNYKRTRPRDDAPWTSSEEEMLIRTYESGKNIFFLANQFLRNPTTIEAKINELAKVAQGLDDPQTELETLLGDFETDKDQLTEQFDDDHYWHSERESITNENSYLYESWEDDRDDFDSDYWENYSRGPEDQYDEVFEPPTLDKSNEVEVFHKPAKSKKPLVSDIDDEDDCVFPF